MIQIDTKAIFLDIDGVLNASNSKSYCGKFLGIDKDKTQRLARIVNKTNSILILSSSWKVGWEPRKRYDLYTPPIYYHAKYLNNHLSSQ